MQATAISRRVRAGDRFCRSVAASVVRAGAARQEGKAGIRAHRRPGRQGRRVGADFAGAREPDARHGETDGRATSTTISARATAAPSSRRRSAARARPASSTTRTWSRCRSAMRRRKASARKRQFIHGDIFETDFSKATRDHALSAARAEREAASEDPRHEARHARRLQLVHDGRLAGRPTHERDRERRLHRPTAPRISGSCPRKSKANGRLPDGELMLKQTYPERHRLARREQRAKAACAAIRSRSRAGGAQYTAKVSGDTMTGTVKSGGNTSNFTATKRRSRNDFVIASLDRAGT